MENFLNSINSVDINDSASLSAFSNLVANRRIKNGIYKSSTRFRNDSLMDNYNDGFGFVPAYDVLGGPQNLSYNSNNDNIEISTLFGNPIGTDGHISYYSNSVLKFLTPDRFLRFNELIRRFNIDIHKDVGYDYSKYKNNGNATPKFYIDEFDDSGSYFTVFNDLDYGNYYIKRDFAWDGVNEKIIPDVPESFVFSDLIRRKYLLEMSNNVYFNKEEVEQSYLPNYDELRSVDEKSTLESKRNSYDFSVYGKILNDNSYLEKITEYNRNIGGDGYYIKENPYAVDKESYDFINKLFNNSNHFRKKGDYKDVDITKDKDGNLTTFNTVVKNMSYAYYEENKIKEIGKAETSFNSSVGIGKYDGDKISLLLRNTNKLFRENKIKTLVNRFKTDGGELFKNDELVTSYTEDHGISRGRNLLKKGGADPNDVFENPYCRVWTAAHQYSKLKHRIRPFYDGETPISIENLQNSFGSDLRPNNGAQRLGNNSVLKNDGFVRISPEHNKGKFSDIKNIKKYMFSLENLAWRDVINSAGLSAEQRGPNYGRIMWFPPYNLKFTENVNVEWNANKFIGRGEQIYTYTNTDRSGTLSFTLLIDHPSIINKWRTTSEDVDKNPYEDDLLRFFAGCQTLDGNASGKQDEQPQQEEPNPSTTPKLGKNTTTFAYVMFFPNNYTGHDDDYDTAMDNLLQYENSGSTLGSQPNVFCVDSSFANHTMYSANTSEYKLNYDLTDEIKEKVKSTLLSEENDENLVIIPIFNADSGYTKLVELVTNESIFGISTTSNTCNIEKIRYQGFASSHGIEEINDELSLRRANMIAKIVNNNSFELQSVSNKEYGDSRVIEVLRSNSASTINTIDAKIARSAVLMVDVVWDENTKANNEVEYYEDGGDVITTAFGIQPILVENLDSGQTESNEHSLQHEEADYSYRYDNEYLYFNEVRGNEMVYKSILDKVKYFSPAFHSITPEGFNSRLTFLQQCTRQGPTMSVSGGRVNTNSDDYLKFAGNLAFGRPPYCILRIGDFFHTKICITSLSIDYDNGGGLQWDLNPEGIGVQPMFANVNINFNFIGGQDIAGPVERLQNAVSYNYYANTSIYEIKSDFGRSRNSDSKEPIKVPYDPYIGTSTDFYHEGV